MDLAFLETLSLFSLPPTLEFFLTRLFFSHSELGRAQQHTPWGSSIMASHRSPHTGFLLFSRLALKRTEATLTAIIPVIADSGIMWVANAQGKEFIVPPKPAMPCPQREHQRSPWWSSFGAPWPKLQLKLGTRHAKAGCVPPPRTLGPLKILHAGQLPLCPLNTTTGCWCRGPVCF